MAMFDQQDIERRAAQFKRELEAMPNNWFLKTFLPPQETTTMTTTEKLNTGQPAIKGYRNLSQAEIDLMNEIKEAGEQLRHLVTRVQNHINSQPAPEVPHSQVTNPGRWAALAQTDLQTGLMALTRAVAQPTSF